AVLSYVLGHIDKAADDDIEVQHILRQTSIDPPIIDELTITIKGYCIPHGTVRSQLVDAVCKYLHDTPEQRYQGGSWIVQSALQTTWEARNLYCRAEEGK